MRRVTFLMLLLTILPNAGCLENKFKIEMRRTEDGRVERRLTVWSQDGGNKSAANEEVLRAARAVYTKPEKESESRHSFVGKFDGVLPADLSYSGLSNYGVLGEKSCSLGRVRTYVERMPGRTDLARMVSEGQESVDIFIRAMVAWAKTREDLRSDPAKLDKLTNFLERDFRDDMMTVLLMGWQMVIRYDVYHYSASDAEEANEETQAEIESRRITHFLVERGYLSPGEQPFGSEPSGAVVLHGVISKAREAMGYGEGESSPPSLAGLGDAEAFEAAFKEGLEQIGVTEEEFSKKFEDLMPTYFGTRTTGEVTWQDVNEPLMTNGQWTPERRSVSWQAHGSTGCQTPQILYATWAEPDEAEQTRHFGRVVLTGERLRDYLEWRETLPEPRRLEWEAFLSKITPEAGYEAKLRGFEFSSMEGLSARDQAVKQQGGPVVGVSLILGE